MLNESQKTIIYLFEKGYRVSEGGVFTNPKGEVMNLKVKSNHKYPQTQVRRDGKSRNFHIHRLAAYCFYGEALFEKNIHVRHLNGDVLDISKKNIALGSPSENEQDKPKSMRVKNARNAVNCRKDTRRLTMRKLTDEQARDIKIRLQNKENGAEIAREYSMSKDSIYQIKRGVTYTDIII